MDIEQELSKVSEFISSSRRLDAQELLEQLINYLKNEAPSDDNSKKMLKVRDYLADLLFDMGYHKDAIDQRNICLGIIDSLEMSDNHRLTQLCKLSDNLSYFLDSLEEKNQVLSVAEQCLITTSQALKLMEANNPRKDEFKQRLVTSFLYEQTIGNFNKL